ncbi:craniofacial development protein 2-like [Palaemon carinicauda]|uniref:craniofacial development protein 2-like n=1 Tax=Palaemon carinicauda TaxID=392227 RepID=UPI0035B60A37
MSIIVFYALTNDSPEERKDEYYESLQTGIDEMPDRDMKFMIDDLKAKAGNDNHCIENVMGVEGLEIHKYTWTSPCGNYKIQKDHIERRITLRNVRLYRGEDIGSDHHILIAKLKLELKAANKNLDRIPMFDINR